MPNLFGSPLLAMSASVTTWFWLEHSDMKSKGSLQQLSEPLPFARGTSPDDVAANVEMLFRSSQRPSAPAYQTEAASTACTVEAASAEALADNASAAEAHFLFALAANDEEHRALERVAEQLRADLAEQGRRAAFVEALLAACVAAPKVAANCASGPDFFEMVGNGEVADDVAADSQEHVAMTSVASEEPDVAASQLQFVLMSLDIITALLRDFAQLVFTFFSSAVFSWPVDSATPSVPVVSTSPLGSLGFYPSSVGSESGGSAGHPFEFPPWLLEVLTVVRDVLMIPLDLVRPYFQVLLDGFLQRHPEHDAALGGRDPLLVAGVLLAFGHLAFWEVYGLSLCALSALRFALGLLSAPMRVCCCRRSADDDEDECSEDEEGVGAWCFESEMGTKGVEAKEARPSRRWRCGGA